MGGRDGEMGSPSGEPAPEAFRKGDSAGVQNCGGDISGERKTGYCVELSEDASLYEGYGRVGRQTEQKGSRSAKTC